MPFKQLLITCVLVCALPLASTHAGLFSPKGDDIEEKRATIREQSREMLGELYEAHPELKESLKEAVGYATFRQSDINLLVVASGFGYGVLHDNRDGKDTYMRVATLGGGLGAGVKDIRVVFVFNDEDVMDSFIEKGWQFGGKADASAKYEETGVAAEQNVKANVNLEEGEVAGAASNDARAGKEGGEQAAVGAGLGEAMQIYQFTESGISLQATIAGTKYWKSDKLNY